MSDKHEAKQKILRAKAHVASFESKAKPNNARSIEGEAKDAEGFVQVDSGKMRERGNHTHRG